MSGPAETGHAPQVDKAIAAHVAEKDEHIVSTNPEYSRHWYKEEHAGLHRVSAMYALAKVVGPECADVNAAYMTCRKDNENKHPSRCLEAGLPVRHCVWGVSTLSKRSCNDSFTAFSKCLQDSGNKYEQCRDFERLFKQCYVQAKYDQGITDIGKMVSTLPASGTPLDG